jgi:hypothetical protein
VAECTEIHDRQVFIWVSINIQTHPPTVAALPTATQYEAYASSEAKRDAWTEALGMGMRRRITQTQATAQLNFQVCPRLFQHPSILCFAFASMYGFWLSTIRIFKRNNNNNNNKLLWQS